MGEKSQNIEVDYTKDGFVFTYLGNEILKHTKDFPMVYVGYGTEKVEMYRGNFKIEDYLEERYPLRNALVEKTTKGFKVRFSEKLLAYIQLEENLIKITFDKLDARINRFFLRLPATKEEKCYGCGEQMSYFNLRGRNYPLWTSEPGVGRDKTTYVTWRSDVENKAGGDYYNTNYPQPTFVSTKHYYFHMDSTSYADFNFKNEEFHELELYEVPQGIRIETAGTYMNLLEKMTAHFGRQKELPEWVYNGLILGLQGGNERVTKILDETLAHHIKVSGVWCQDWCGKRETSFGKRLQWNWKYQEAMYPNLPDQIRKLHAKNIKFLAYINPYLVNDGDLYEEGKRLGYFATKKDGSDYLVDFGEFYCGVVDLTNPDAFLWFKNIIIKYMINIGVDGWMADFGEYLPTDDIVLTSGESAMIEHNHWPVLWAKCNYEALEDTDSFGKVLYFMRAGGTGSQKYCTLMWAGDQSVDFSIHDGLGTVICAALSSGMSGCGLNHSDIGGYTSLFDNVRTKEVFLRWAEMAAFMPIMRTHEGNRPDTNFQYYDDEDCMNQLARLVDIYTMLSKYTRMLVKENAKRGIPVMRPLFLHYETDENAYEQQYEYLYGPDLLVAPVYLEHQTERRVYIPEGSWIHFWSGKAYGKGECTVKAGVGEIPVFYRKGSEYADLFEEIMKKGV